MTITEIFIALHAHYRKTGRVPTVKGRRVASIFKEAYRKIGSRRKALYISGVISNERCHDYPQLAYLPDGAGYRIEPASMSRLRAVCRINGVMKERLL